MGAYTVHLGDGPTHTYWGNPATGHVQARGRAELGTDTSSFGHRDYWRLALTMSFGERVSLTEEGRRW